MMNFELRNKEPRVRIPDSIQDRISEVCKMLGGEIHNAIIRSYDFYTVIKCGEKEVIFEFNGNTHLIDNTSGEIPSPSSSQEIASFLIGSKAGSGDVLERIAAIRAGASGTFHKAA